MEITHEDFICPRCGSHMNPIYDAHGKLVGARCLNNICLVSIRFD